MDQISSRADGIGVDRLPAGYVRFAVDSCQVVSCRWAVSALRDALRCGSLFEWSAAQSSRDAMRGRGEIYGVTLPAGPLPDESTAVVVRRNRHGGLLRRLTGEYFLSPTRAPLELAISVRLAAAGIPTPEVIAYAIYPAVGIFARSDVVTRRLPEGDDFPAAWKRADRGGRDLMLAAAARLLRSLAMAGAWHADLNLKNIYMAGSGTDLAAYLLDLDRVTFPGGNDIATRNITRLMRSARKWREKWGLDFDEDSLSRLTDLAEEKK